MKAKQQMSSIYKVMALLFSVYILLAGSVARANYGESCTPVPLPLTDSYFTDSTAYGYLVGNIDMKEHTPTGCEQPEDQIQFCIRGQGANPCDLVTMNLNEQRAISSISTNPDIGGNSFIGPIIVTAEPVGGSLCLTMPSSRGPAPIICREIALEDSEVLQDQAGCKTTAQNCFEAENYSQNLLKVSGKAVHCLLETLDKVFYEGEECVPFDEDISYSALAPFADFQDALKNAVRAALILYVMVYGFKVVLNIQNAELNHIALFIIKFILVVYFAVGLGPLNMTPSGPRQENGMTEWALPALVGATNSFTKMVFDVVNARGLCNFDESRYPNGYEYYSLWDSLDCRIAYYYGMQMVYNMGPIVDGLTGTTDDLGFGSNSPASFASGSTDAPAVVDDALNLGIFTMIFGFVMSGNIIFVLCAMIFGIFFLGMVLYLLSVYMVCIVTLYVLTYISPIFIPMALFERTKGYFDSWLRLLFSCALQPAMVGGFIALIVTTYDVAMYGNCEYLRHDYTINEYNFSTFEIRIPDADPEKCTESPGYSFIKYYSGEGWEERIMLFFSVTMLRDVYNLVKGMVYIVIFTLIFYYILQYVSEFASDLTYGANVGGVTFSPQTVARAAMKAAKNGAQLAFAALAVGTGNLALLTALGAQGAMAAQDKMSSRKRTGDSINTDSGTAGGEFSDSMSSVDLNKDSSSSDDKGQDQSSGSKADLDKATDSGKGIAGTDTLEKATGGDKNKGK